MEDDYWKECWHGFFDYVRWNQVIFVIVVMGAAIAYFGYFAGLLLGGIFIALCNLDGGAVLDLNGDYPPEEFPPNTCSANIENCRICNNEYDHDFNQRCKDEEKWYEKIL